MPKKLPPRTVLLVASGDLRPSANKVCWPAQRAMERSASAAAVAQLGYRLRARPSRIKPAQKHGFIGSQKEGIEVFAGIDPRGPARSWRRRSWQYSHHVLPGLITHEGPDPDRRELERASGRDWSGC